MQRFKIVILRQNCFRRNQQRSILTPAPSLPDFICESSLYFYKKKLIHIHFQFSVLAASFKSERALRQHWEAHQRSLPIWR